MIAKALQEFFKWMGSWFWSFIVNSSYWIFLSIAMIGLFCYIAGFKKGAKYITFSTIAYTLIQCINSAI